MVDEAKQQFQIQRIYTKDLSFESPNSPKVFLQKDWKPEISVDLNITNSNVENDVHEVVLTLTLTAKVKEETAFLAEIKQAGIFQVDGFDDVQMKHMLGAFCPNILFPYAREVVSDLVNRGSFPQLLLAPINFEALYQQQLKAAADAKEGKETKKEKVTAKK